MPDGGRPRRRNTRPAHVTEVRETERGAADAERSPFVLVVDDVEDNRELYATFFTYAGYRAEQASDGEEALSKIARERPDVVLMDLSMPNVDGWEATRLIKSNPRTKGIIVVVVTGFATRDDLDRARAAGADDVCTKPCLPKDLVARVAKLLAGK
jgi:two-component system, cell cycle response regulator DivK